MTAMERIEVLQVQIRDLCNQLDAERQEREHDRAVVVARLDTLEGAVTAFEVSSIGAHSVTDEDRTLVLHALEREAPGSEQARELRGIKAAMAEERSVASRPSLKMTKVKELAPRAKSSQSASRSASCLRIPSAQHGTSGGSSCSAAAASVPETVAPQVNCIVLSDDDDEDAASVVGATGAKLLLAPHALP